MSRLILVLGDQLTREIAALRELAPGDVVVMAEVADEAGYVPHHPKKIVLIFSAMRHFAEALRQEGVRVDYTKLDDAENTGSITGELIRAAAVHKTDQVIATAPGEWRLIAALDACPLNVTQLADDRFICAQPEFDAWAEGRKELRMEWFYRDMRRKTGLLMQDGAPVGGKWNYDQDNRKAPPKGMRWTDPMAFPPDQITQEVLELVRENFPSNYYHDDAFQLATTRGDALKALDHFIATALPTFGDYQDAMLLNEPFLSHALISPYLNVGLLGPLEVCRAAEDAYHRGDAPLNAVEGFIRQIIGWREYIRGIYFREGPDYTDRNVLDHKADLPEFYWSADTDMRCVSQCVGQTMQHGYAHHIQRLMVTGNFALLAGIDPHQVHEWYLAVYVDAYEWVEAPNVIGMSQFADGGIVASKPYISSANYIQKMSNYCKTCTYSPKVKTGEGACPFNLLYWGFLDRHRDRFVNNPRMGNMYRVWDRMDAEKQKTILAQAAEILEKIAKSDRV